MEDARGINRKQSAFGLSALLTINAVQPGNGALRFEVGQQRQAQFTVFAKRQMAPNSVHRDTDNLGLVLGKFGQQLVIQPQLVSAYGTPVRRVEDQHDRPSAEFRERNLLVGSAWKRKVRRECAGF